QTNNGQVDLFRSFGWNTKEATATTATTADTATAAADSTAAPANILLTTAAATRRRSSTAAGSPTPAATCTAPSSPKPRRHRYSGEGIGQLQIDRLMSVICNNQFGRMIVQRNELCVDLTRVNGFEKIH